MMRRLAGIVLLLALMTVARAATEMRLSPKPVRDEVRTVVEAQVAALRAGDYSAAYGFAAEGIKRQFDERLFTLMIRRGYVPLLHANQTDLGVVRDNGEGSAQVTVTVTDKQGRATVYRYWLEREDAGWRISGVVLEQKPRRADL